MTGRVNICCSCDFIFNFFAFFSKMSQSISPLPVIFFFFYEILCSSNFLGLTSPRCCSQGFPGGWIKIFTKLVDIYHRKTRWKKLRWLLYKWGRYLSFWTLKKKKINTAYQTNKFKKCCVTMAYLLLKYCEKKVSKLMQAISYI